MAYGDFTLQSARKAFGLAWRDEILYADVAPQPVRPDLWDTVERGHFIATQISTEMAKVNFIISPILMEMKRLLADKISIFSGIEFSVDRERGLTGVCDFLISKGAMQYYVTAPVLAVVEAKNESLAAGLGQCVAEMVAAQLFNKGTGSEGITVHGIVSTGSAWRFLRLTGTLLEVDKQEYFVVELGKIIGVLTHILS